MEKILDAVHLIKGDENQNLLFHIDSNSILRINDLVYNIITSLKKKYDLSGITEHYQISLEQLKEFLNNLLAPLDKTEKIKIRQKEKSIDRLTLIISNDCNLKCTYCYADGGNYKKEKKLMSAASAKEILTFFADRDYMLKSIVFFGGEPLLNFETLEFVCRFCHDLKKEGKLKIVPSFGIVTNATILNDKIFELIEKYKIGVTVSLDGPQDINDLHRKTNSGQGTYHLVNRFIKRLTEIKNSKFMIEATYTHDHIDLGYSVDNIKTFLKKNFNCNSVIVPELALEEEKNKQRKISFTETNNFFKDPSNRKIEIDSTILSKLYHIKEKVQCENCRVGEKYLAIDPDGEIYPCHMTSFAPATSLGNINGQNIFDNYRYYKSENNYLKSVTKEGGECKDCWARNLCSGCSVKKFFSRSTGQFNSEPNEDICFQTREYLKNFLLKLSYAQTDKEKWLQIVERINNNSQEIEECV